MSTDYSVYWAPGCTSCLRTKEFLLRNGVAFQSINVVEDSDAMEDLAALGFRSVPVVRRGDQAVFCQELQDVAAFVGLELEKSGLTEEQLVAKVDGVMRAAQRFIRQLNEEQLVHQFPGRDRSYRDVGFHLFMVVQGFLEAARGGSLEYEVFLRTPPDELRTASDIASAGEDVRQSFLAWWQDQRHRLPETLSTYYGEKPLLGVLERTTWHAAQHCRQMQAVVEQFGLVPDGPLGEAELSGLPLPEDIYDNEIPLSDEAR